MRGRKPIKICIDISIFFNKIKKESPNEGTETLLKTLFMIFQDAVYKKRIPEWGDGNGVSGVTARKPHGLP